MVKKRLARALSKTRHTSEDFEGLPDRCREAGVALVFVDAFPSAKIDGGAMATPAERPNWHYVTGWRSVPQGLSMYSRQAPVSSRRATSVPR